MFSEVTFSWAFVLEQKERKVPMIKNDIDITVNKNCNSRVHIIVGTVQ